VFHSLAESLLVCGSRFTECGDPHKGMASPSEGTSRAEPRIVGLRRSQWEPAGPSVVMFKERAAMVLGMNPRPLQERRPWLLFLWKEERRWAVVMQPSGSPFTACVVDDFLYDSGKRGVSMELPSDHLSFVFELVAEGGWEGGARLLLLSVKPDFCTLRYPQVTELGPVGPYTFEEVVEHVLMAAEGCWTFGVASDGSSFAADLADVLGQRALPRAAPVPFTIDWQIPILTEEEKALLQAIQQQASTVTTLSRPYVGYVK